MSITETYDQAVRQGQLAQARRVLDALESEPNIASALNRIFPDGAPRADSDIAAHGMVALLTYHVRTLLTLVEDAEGEAVPPRSERSTPAMGGMA